MTNSPKKIIFENNKIILPKKSLLSFSFHLKSSLSYISKSSAKISNFKPIDLDELFHSKDFHPSEHISIDLEKNQLDKSIGFTISDNKVLAKFAIGSLTIGKYSAGFNLNSLIEAMPYLELKTTSSNTLISSRMKNDQTTKFLLEKKEYKNLTSTILMTTAFDKAIIIPENFTLSATEVKNEVTNNEISDKADIAEDQKDEIKSEQALITIFSGTDTDYKGTTLNIKEEVDEDPNLGITITEVNSESSFKISSTKGELLRQLLLTQSEQNKDTSINISEATENSQQSEIKSQSTEDPKTISASPETKSKEDDEQSIENNTQEKPWWGQRLWNFGYNYTIDTYNSCTKDPLGCTYKVIFAAGICYTLYRITIGGYRNERLNHNPVDNNYNTPPSSGASTPRSETGENAQQNIVPAINPTNVNTYSHQNTATITQPTLITFNNLQQLQRQQQQIFAQVHTPIRTVKHNTQGKTPQTIQYRTPYLQTPTNDERDTDLSSISTSSSNHLLPPNNRISIETTNLENSRSMRKPIIKEMKNLKVLELSHEQQNDLYERLSRKVKFVENEVLYNNKKVTDPYEIFQVRLLINSLTSPSLTEPMEISAADNTFTIEENLEELGGRIPTQNDYSMEIEDNQNKQEENQYHQMEVEDNQSKKPDDLAIHQIQPGTNMLSNPFEEMEVEDNNQKTQPETNMPLQHKTASTNQRPSKIPKRAASKKPSTVPDNNKKQPNPNFNIVKYWDKLSIAEKREKASLFNKNNHIIINPDNSAVIINNQVIFNLPETLRQIKLFAEKNYHTTEDSETNSLLTREDNEFDIFKKWNSLSFEEKGIVASLFTKDNSITQAPDSSDLIVNGIVIDDLPKVLKEIVLFSKQEPFEKEVNYNSGLPQHQNNQNKMRVPSNKAHYQFATQAITNTDHTSSLTQHLLENDKRGQKRNFVTFNHEDQDTSSSDLEISYDQQEKAPESAKKRTRLNTDSPTLPWNKIKDNIAKMTEEEINSVQGYLNSISTLGSSNGDITKIGEQAIDRETSEKIKIFKLKIAGFNEHNIEDFLTMLNNIKDENEINFIYNKHFRDKIRTDQSGTVIKVDNLKIKNGNHSKKIKEFITRAESLIKELSPLNNQNSPETLASINYDMGNYYGDYEEDDIYPPATKKLDFLTPYRSNSPGVASDITTSTKNSKVIIFTPGKGLTDTQGRNIVLPANTPIASKASQHSNVPKSKILQNQGSGSSQDKLDLTQGIKEFIDTIDIQKEEDKALLNSQISRYLNDVYATGIKNKNSLINSLNKLIQDEPDSKDFIKKIKPNSKLKAADITAQYLKDKVVFFNNLSLETIGYIKEPKTYEQKYLRYLEVKIKENLVKEILLTENQELISRLINAIENEALDSFFSRFYDNQEFYPKKDIDTWKVGLKVYLDENSNGRVYNGFELIRKLNKEFRNSALDYNESEQNNDFVRNFKEYLKDYNIKKLQENLGLEASDEDMEFITEDENDVEAYVRYLEVVIKNKLLQAFVAGSTLFYNFKGANALEQDSWSPVSCDINIQSPEIYEECMDSLVKQKAFEAQANKTNINTESESNLNAYEAYGYGVTTNNLMCAVSTSSLLATKLPNIYNSFNAAPILYSISLIPKTPISGILMLSKALTVAGSSAMLTAISVKEPTDILNAGIMQYSCADKEMNFQDHLNLAKQAICFSSAMVSTPLVGIYIDSYSVNEVCKKLLDSIEHKVFELYGSDSVITNGDVL